MTTFFTVLLITYSMNEEVIESRILYSNVYSCSEAIISIQEVMDQNAKLIMIQCQQSDIISKSTRPRQPNG